MTMQSLERDILREAKEVTGFKKLKRSDILEWNTSRISERPGEDVHHLPIMQVYIALKSKE